MAHSRKHPRAHACTLASALALTASALAGAVAVSERPHGARDAGGPPALAAERILFEQRARLDTALETLEPGTPGRIDAFFLAFAGDGTQDVFLSEARFAGQVLAAHGIGPARRLVLANHPDTIDRLPLATATNLEYALAGLARRMDGEEDLLVLLISSHGTPEHEIVVELGDLPLADLPADGLARMLRDSGIRWRVVILSACYSGGFIDDLAEPHTLIITAADAEQPSFGCDDASDLTYFGRAFFQRALPDAGSFTGAFERARPIIREMERAAGYEHSNPAIHAPPPVREHLRRWRAQRPNADTSR